MVGENMELRRQVLIRMLNNLGIYESCNGELLTSLSIQELEIEYSRAKDREGWSQ